MKFIVYILASVIFSLSAQANETNETSHTQSSHYAGEENRSIKSLSANDIAELKRGGGWGLAKAAELNGVPGPAHLLEMKNEILLSREQTVQIEALFNQMKTQAIELGERLIANEQELELLFQSGSLSRDDLRASLIKISNTRMELRFIHLATHLKTPDILSPEQIKTYNDLRGYTNSDPCAHVPEGHDVEMWRKHNGCP